MTKSFQTSKTNYHAYYTRLYTVFYFSDQTDEEADWQFDIITRRCGLLIFETYRYTSLVFFWTQFFSCVEWTTIGKLPINTWQLLNVIYSFFKGIVFKKIVLCSKMVMSNYILCDIILEVRAPWKRIFLQSLTQSFMPRQAVSDLNTSCAPKHSVDV